MLAVVKLIVPAVVSRPADWGVDDRRGLVRQHSLALLLLHKHVTDLLFLEKQNETKHICAYACCT